MYFKKLELFGFKSFANRTKLIFEPGVTAVVGPNGVGKSNISDAIKWVLGEQSAKELRGGKMEDVIFNGTDTIQPVNIAEVSLTLSNEDRYLPIECDEIIVTRRVFRSGESEYLLNKTQVRLKDIQDLFLGTGIGTSSYSISEQGKMQRVLDARPEDRREIFEEASGITKYKTKKKEALRKLEHTENNLIRLADIINEAKRQINSIERQAKKAQKYQQEFDCLKGLDVKFSLHKYKNIIERKDAKDKERQQLKQKQDVNSYELNAHTQGLRNQRRELTTLEQTLLDTRNRLVDTAATIDKNASKTSLNEERVKEITSRRTSLTAEIEHIEGTTESLNQKINQMQQALDELGKQNDEKQNIVRQRQEGLEKITSGTKECEVIISQSKIDTMDNMAKQSKAKNELAKVSANTVSLSHRHRRLAAEKEATYSQISTYTDKFKQAESALKKQAEETEAHHAQLKQSKENLQSFNKEHSFLSESIASYEKSLAGCVSKLEILTNLTEKREGLPEGVKSYLEMLNESKEVKDSFIGILADIIKVKPGYERAIEAAIGDELQSIVLKDEDAAMKAVDYLVNQQKGKASFIILDRCSQQKRRFSFGTTQPAQGLSEIIDIEETHQGLISYLFDGIFFAKNIEEAFSIIKKSRDRDIKVVTKDGSSVSYNRIVGGGIGSQEYTGIAGRRFRIGRLSKEAEGLKGKIEQAKQRRESLVKQIDFCQKDSESKDAVLREEEKILAQKGTDRSGLEAELKKLEEEFNLVRMELGEMSQQQEELKNTENSLKEELNSIESEHQNLQDIISAKEKAIASNGSEKDSLLISFTEAKTVLSLLSEKYASQENTLTMLKDSLDKDELNLQNRKSQIKEGEERVEYLNSETQRITQENEILEQQKGQLKDKVAELEKMRYSIDAEVEKVDEGDRTQQVEMDE